LISGIFDRACTELPYISTSSSKSDTTNMFGDPLSYTKERTLSLPGALFAR